MPTFQKCPPEIQTLATKILRGFERHAPLLEHKIKIDFLFAYPAYDANDVPKGDALKHNGVKALGLTRVCSLKERVKGHGDAEITLDFEWWDKAPDPEKNALLDHELHHLALEKNKMDIVKVDDIGRPKLRLRKHDFQFGWFTEIAKVHGIYSQEWKQASRMNEVAGQYLFPFLTGHLALEGRAAHLEVHNFTETSG